MSQTNIKHISIDGNTAINKIQINIKCWNKIKKQSQ